MQETMPPTMPAAKISSALLSIFFMPHIIPQSLCVMLRILVLVLISALWYNTRHLREVTEVKISGAVVREGDFPSHGYAQ